MYDIDGVSDYFWFEKRLHRLGCSDLIMIALINSESTALHNKTVDFLQDIVLVQAKQSWKV